MDATDEGCFSDLRLLQEVLFRLHAKRSGGPKARRALALFVEELTVSVTDDGSGLYRFR